MVSDVWDMRWFIMEEVSFKLSFDWALEAFNTKIAKLAAIKYFITFCIKMILFRNVTVFRLSIFMLFSVALFSCKEDECIDAPDASHIEVTVKIERLEKKLYKIPTKSELRKLLAENPAFAESFLDLSKYPSEDILIDRYFGLLNSAEIDSLFLEVEREFGEMEDIRLQFEEAFRLLKYYYPEIKIPRIQTVVTGIANDLFISDSVIVIGIDYYLGPQGEYRPLNIPNYILKRYQKEYLVPQIMLLYSAFFVETNYQDQTTLADMIYYGKAYYLAKNVMPCTPDSIFTGYTSFETEDIDEHEPVIWASILENEVLYENNPYVKDKFLSERPKTLEIGEKCPGRIGRWLGWRIIQKYAEEHPDVSIPELMKMNDAQKLFGESKYKPIPY